MKIVMESEIKTLASGLIDVKQKIRELLDIEQSLKEQLKPLIKEQGTIKLDADRVYYGESKGALTFSRLVVLNYIREHYGDALANQIDEDYIQTGGPLQSGFPALIETIKHYINE